jgi:hypothetical protein
MMKESIIELSPHFENAACCRTRIAARCGISSQAGASSRTIILTNFVGTLAVDGLGVALAAFGYHHRSRVFVPR